MKRAVQLGLMTLAIGTSAQAWGGGGGGGGSTAPSCTVKIVHADQVVTQSTHELMFRASVSGGCDASTVTWGTRYVSPNGTVTNTVAPQGVSDPNILPSYSTARLDTWNLDYRMPRHRMPNDSGGYTEVTATISGKSDTVKIIGSDVPLGSDADNAAVRFTNSRTNHDDVLPFWYFLERVRAERDYYNDVWQYQGVYDGHAHENGWYAKGFYDMNDMLYFDQYAGLNFAYGYVVANPPGEDPIYVASEPKVNSITAQSISEQAASSCNFGDCIGVGGIFLGYQNPEKPWSYVSVWGSLRKPWQHAAIKTGFNEFVDAPQYGTSVRRASWQTVTNGYYKQQAYLDVNSEGGQYAADWAIRQERKPYQVTEMPRFSKRGIDANYEGFYCSLLVWAAWYHGTGTDISYGIEAPFFAFILPTAFYEAYRHEGKLTLKTEFSRL